MNEPKASRGIFEKIIGSGEWWIRFTDSEGKYRREKVGSYAAARDLLAIRRADALRGVKLPPLRKRPVLFKQIADLALEFSKKNKRSKDESLHARLVKLFGARPADLLTSSEIEKQLEAMMTAKGNKWKNGKTKLLAPSTVNHYRAFLMLSFREGRRAGLVAGDPVRDVRHRREDNERVNYLKASEEEKLRQIIVTHYPEHVPEFDFALATGLRKGSQYTLEWSMVDLTAKMMHIPTSKTDRALHLPLNEKALAALRVVKARGNESGRVFRSGDGEALVNSRHWFGAAVSKAGLSGFHWHDLRHCFASKLRMNGARLEDIAELLGHSKKTGLAMTMRYAHLGPEQLHNVVALVDFASTTVAPMQNSTETTSSGYVN